MSLRDDIELKSVRRWAEEALEHASGCPYREERLACRCAKDPAWANGFAAGQQSKQARIEELEGDAATLQGYIKTHGETPMMTRSRLDAALSQVAALRQAMDRIMRDYFDDSRISPRLEAECQRALCDTRPKP